MRVFGLVISITFLCVGCVTQPTVVPSLAYDPQLINGTPLFGEEVTPAPTVDLLHTNAAMRAFVAKEIGNSDFRFTRFKRLMTGLVQGGFFVDQYDRDASHPADKTFELRKGNCLAYTNLFIALAREAGLEATYQLVNTQPTWDVESGFLVRNNHVNVLVSNVSTPGATDSELVVDFNTYAVPASARRTLISDAYAESMYYGNLGIQALHAKDMRGAFAQLKRGVLTEAWNIDLWNNLGALYSILQQPELAQRSYKVAMTIDGEDKTAVSGMAKTARQLGDFATAEHYTQLALRYQRRNPFYHYALAEQAYRRDAFEEALAAVNNAIALEKTNPRFYALRAATAHELGNANLVRQSRALAIKHAGNDAQNLKPFVLN